MKKIARAVAVAAYDYLKSPQARRWEIALLSGVGIAVEQAIKHNL